MLATVAPTGATILAVMATMTSGAADVALAVLSACRSPIHEEATCKSARFKRDAQLYKHPHGAATFKGAAALALARRAIGEALRSGSEFRPAQPCSLELKSRRPSA